ncbi:DUF2326 domain-containing protein [Vibrio vulnificus]|uniref:DUF2326 domain-containing protein n=1 Tax=Vibrio vulnificus TaxID=672 RepID=UPI001CDC6FFB|nr:DUF2326 domain-containing protein [Vibrio vulnificus]MCA3970773.1 DUF2326 domain-containing protein [Vibrio vulnificus]
MFLKSLLIECDTHIIRNIPFHKGMNFIVDETKASNSSAVNTGNNIGKTTVIRLINYCLGGNEKNIYQSKEFKNNINETVKSFLHDKNVKLTLRLQENLEDPLSKQVEICRNFLSGSKRILEVDGKPVLSKNLDMELKKKIFSYEEKKPTFKQLKAKNIRDEAERLENTVRVLGNFGKLEEYEALYLFWLGIDYPDAEKKRLLLEERSIEDKLYTRLFNENSESKLKQFLTIIQRDIDNLEIKKNSFNINDEYESDLVLLNETRANLNSFYSKQSQLELRKDLIEESCTELMNNLASTQTSLLSELYEQANLLLPELKKTYSETVAFHNKMIEEKIHFVSGEIPNIDAQLSKLNSDIQDSLVKEKRLVDNLNKSDAIDDLQEIISQLNAKYEQKGRLEEKLEQLVSSRETLEGIDKKLSDIDKSIYALDDLVQERVSKFNQFFSEISNNLYGEKFALSATFEQKKNTDQHFYKLYIDSLDGQTGTGKKKGEIAAFDIAYVKFAESIGIDCLHFIMHDQMEVVDDNQIEGLVQEVIRSNCQFIVPILRDKLPVAIDKPEYQALSLSQDDKLFKI